MSVDSFADRVHALRDSWIERRQLRPLASAHDFESQFQLLTALYSWTARASDEVGEVYGRDFDLRLSPPPGPFPQDAAFSLSVADAFVLSFRLGERGGAAGPGWFVSVTITTTRANGNAVTAGPERRHGQWTRGRVEELLLTVLGAYERSLSEVGEARGFGARVRARGA